MLQVLNGLMIVMVLLELIMVTHVTNVRAGFRLLKPSFVGGASVHTKRLHIICLV